MYNVLICDDQPDIVNALKIYLKPEGYSLFEAYTGTEALEIVKKEDIHLILLDIMISPQRQRSGNSPMYPSSCSPQKVRRKTRCWV